MKNGRVQALRLQEPVQPDRGEWSNMFPLVARRWRRSGRFPARLTRAAGPAPVLARLGRPDPP